MIEVVLHYHVSKSKVAVCMDFAYVYGGLQGGALRWRANGLSPTQGPCTNVDLRIIFMDLVDSTSATWVWIKVPSQRDILGNDLADKLATTPGAQLLTALSYGATPPSPPEPHYLPQWQEGGRWPV